MVGLKATTCSHAIQTCIKYLLCTQHQAGFKDRHQPHSPKPPAHAKGPGPHRTQGEPGHCSGRTGGKGVAVENGGLAGSVLTLSMSDKIRLAF